MPFELDPRFTFDSFVVGPANRLAVAAARRVADEPSRTYNPLFIYSASGLGKTHLLTAIGHQVRRLPAGPVVFETLESLMNAISAAVEAGERDAYRGRLQETGVLLLDDVQFLAGQRQVQEELIRTWDALSGAGTQVVLTSDRPPQEIDGLDDRVLSRLSGGLIVDMAAPDYETRVAIARRKAEERGRPLSVDVCRAVGRIAFTNVRELQGALNRLIAVQELEDRTVRADEVVELLGAAAERGEDEFGEFLSNITGTVNALVDEGDRLVADAILAWEGEGYRTRRLEGALGGALTAAQAQALIQRYEKDVARLRRIEAEIRALDPGARELDPSVLHDPDRVAEAEARLAAVRERQTPPPAPPGDVELDRLDDDSLALRAARAVARAPGRAFNPLYVTGPEGAGKSTLLAALGNTIRHETDLSVGYLDADTFTDGVIEALEHSRLDAWRARLQSVDVLLLDDLDRLAETERALEELFYLFEALHRDDRQLVFAATRPPHELAVPDRLRSRLESGLVVELGRSPALPPDVGERGSRRGRGPSAAEASSATADVGDGGLQNSGRGRTAEASETASTGADTGDGGEEGARAEPAASGSPASAGPHEAVEEGGETDAASGSTSSTGSTGPEARPADTPRGRPRSESTGSTSSTSKEKVLWEWPYRGDWIEESLD